MSTLWTVGHSNRELTELLDLLKAAEIERVVDVRRFPGSRRHPHFAAQALAPALADVGLDYEHAPALGGHRRGSPESRNTAWREASLRAYADHMASPEFSLALEHLEAQAGRCRAAILCAEALPTRCHRQLIADAMTVRRWRVVHLLGGGREQVHERHPDLAVTEDGGLLYPGPEERQLDLF
ncbi:MAG: DUF488 domain-containing protein [Acidobacteriota bacterium]